MKLGCVTKRQSALKCTFIISSLLLMMVFCTPAAAGSLEPASAPSPTMKTLSEVEPRTAISSLPCNIASSGSYYLVGNLTLASTDTHAITINADNVTIDLCGFTITGPGKSAGSSGCCIEGMGQKYIKIKNGTIRQFRDAGMDFNNGEGLTVEGVTVENCGGVGIYGYTRVVTLNCVCIKNGSYGILSNGDLMAKDCLASENGGIGIGSSGGNSVIAGCTAYSNAGTGISAGSGSVVENNVSSYNTGYGSGISTGSHSTIRGNTANSNAESGIYGAAGSTITSNSAGSNLGSGIYAGVGCTVSNNTVRYNSDCGIQGDPGSSIISNTIYQNNQSNSVYYGGIRVIDKCLIKNNMISSNKIQNIFLHSSGNVVEENYIADSPIGIKFNYTDNFYTNNRLRILTDDYVGAAGNIDGGGNVSF